jgi:hypothetical protein
MAKTKSYGLIEWKKNRAKRVFIFKQTDLCNRIGIGCIMENFAMFLDIKHYTLTDNAEGFAHEQDLREIYVDANEEFYMRASYSLYNRMIYV